VWQFESGWLDAVSPDARPDELSIGQCQRVPIRTNSRAAPIADEPTSAPDKLVAARVLRLLVTASKQGVAIVIVSHDRRMLKALCHRVLSRVRNLSRE
jgi:ABC-type dipeptide/oligopeptide/nickel transport system ATPase subunit